MRVGPSLELVFEASPNPYMIVDNDLRYVAANAAYCAVTARRREELLGKRVTDVFPHDRDNPGNDNTRRLVDSFRRVFETGQPDVLALIHYRITVDGRELDRYWSATHTPLLDANGRVEYVLQHTTDVTELEAHRRASEAAGMLSRTRVVEERNVVLADSLAVLQHAFSGAPGFMCFLRGPELIVEIANDAYHQLVGPGRPILGRPLREVLPEIDERYFELLAGVMRTGTPYVGRAETVVLQQAPAGPRREVVVDFNYQPVVGEDGKALGVFVLGYDITRQHHAERESERLNRWLTDAFIQAPVALVILRGPDFVVEVTNQRCCEIWGRTREEVLHRPLFDVLPEIRDQGLRELLERVRQTRQPYSGVEVPIELERHGRRDQIYFTFVYQPLIDRDGAVDSVIVVALDVTESVLARRRVETAQAELEAIFDSFPEALFAGNASGVTHVNARARDMLGFSSVDDIRRPVPTVVADVMPRDPATGEPIPRDDLPFARALRGLETRREIMLRKFDTGEDRYVFASGAPVVVAGAPIAAVVTQIDITERKRAEAEVLKLARVLELTHDFVGIAELDGTPTFVNAAGLALMGFPDLEAARRLPVPEYLVPEERARMVTEVIPAAMRDGTWVGELTFQNATTGERIPVLQTVFGLRDGNGTLTALATVTRDLRDQKRLLDAERAARAQAEQANELKDQFLATVSHELRTPLTSILGWMQMLRAGLVTPEKQARALETVERNARIQAQLIDDLLDVSRILSGKLALDLESVEITAVVAAAIETVRPAAEAKGVELRSVIESTAPLLGDPRRLQQVVWNLLSNAVKFTPRGGRVELCVEKREDRVVITVADTGAGIPPDFLPHVFERFRQAEGGINRNAGGLGLGLSIVHHVVTSHRGSVRAYSEGPGKGARFVVELPATLAAIGLRGRDRLVAIEPPPALAGRRAVVVDDESDTRDYVAALLRGAQMHVTVVDAAEAALAAVERERPDALLSDIAMPVTDGYQLVAKLRALPEERGGRTPAVALTAFAHADDRMRALRAGFQNHVAKPIEPAELFAVLVAVLPATSSASPAPSGTGRG